MKTVKYQWDKDLYLVHIEVENYDAEDATIRYFRVNESSQRQDEETRSLKSGEIQRFIFSKKRMDELSLVIESGQNVGVKVFKLWDRAYLPTDADVCELEFL